MFFFFRFSRGEKKPKKKHAVGKIQLEGSCVEAVYVCVCFLMVFPFPFQQVLKNLGTEKKKISTTKKKYIWRRKNIA
ncbi:MAG: hypothetical protein Devi2KO_39890 [Devosia indica]